VTDRLGDGVLVTLNGGTVAFLGNNTPGAASAETLGAVAVNAGASFITSQSGGNPGASSALTIGTLTRAPGTTLTFLPGGNAGTNQSLNTPLNKVLVNTLGAGVALVNGIVPW